MILRSPNSVLLNCKGGKSKDCMLKKNLQSHCT